MHENRHGNGQANIRKPQLIREKIQEKIQAGRQAREQAEGSQEITKASKLSGSGQSRPNCTVTHPINIVDIYVKSGCFQYEERTEVTYVL